VSIPTVAEQTKSLASAACDVAPVVADAANETFRLRRPADRAIEALEEAGIFRMSWPENRGGAGASTATVSDALARIAQADGSVAWVTSVYNAVVPMICMFGDEAIDEFISSDVPRSAGVFAPTGTYTPAAGGYTVSGTWAFASGQHHAGWILAPGVPEGGGPPTAFLVPKSDFTVIDDWQVTGFVGTGSNSVSLERTFVPEHRAVPFMDIVVGNCHAESLRDDKRFHQPFVPYMCAASVGTPIGLARAALELFEKRILGRGITYTTYSEQAAAPVTHFQLAEARMKLDQAELLAARLVATVDEHAATGRSWEEATRVRCRADIAWTVKLCREACEIVEHGSGASAIRETDRLTGVLRDIRAISVHSFLVHSTNAELYGRVLAGLEPGVPFI
jgi:alkylation response protein AidB-like acyl-CoA dehydrogenase